ncbi:hypothetical protein GOP47_0010331, partial [Adiantum capillus-veneris]
MQAFPYEQLPSVAAGAKSSKPTSKQALATLQTAGQEQLINIKGGTENREQR